MGGWMGDHAHVCLIVKIILNLVMKWVVVNMRYTLALNVISIGIIEFFQLVSSFVIGTYSISYTYTYLFVLIISLYLEAQSLFMLSLSFSIETRLKQIFNCFNFQLVSFFKPTHTFIWYFIKGEKTRISYFN